MNPPATESSRHGVTGRLVTARGRCGRGSGRARGRQRLVGAEADLLAGRRDAQRLADGPGLGPFGLGQCLRRGLQRVVRRTAPRPRPRPAASPARRRAPARSAPFGRVRQVLRRDRRRRSRSGRPAGRVVVVEDVAGDVMRGPAASTTAHDDRPSPRPRRARARPATRNGSTISTFSAIGSASCTAPGTRTASSRRSWPAPCSRCSSENSSDHLRRG